jgi:CheY-like chemotaxis protein
MKQMLCRGQHAKEQILVVDDDTEVRACMQDVLELAGYEVRTASNGKEALQRLALEPASLILLDLMMPIMGGAEFLRVRSESDALSRIPVVIVSAWPKEASRIEGAQGFIEKPFNLDALLKLVGDLLLGRWPTLRR